MEEELVQAWSSIQVPRIIAVSSTPPVIAGGFGVEEHHNEESFMRVGEEQGFLGETWSLKQTHAHSRWRIFGRR